MIKSDTDVKTQGSVLNRITFAFCFAPVIYFFLSFYISPETHSQSENGIQIMRNILIFISIVFLIFGLIMAKYGEKLFGKSFEQQVKAAYPDGNVDPVTLRGGVILSRALIAYAFHEAIAIFGLVYFFMSGEREFLIYAAPVAILFICIDRSMISFEQSPEDTIEEYAFKGKK